MTELSSNDPWIGRTFGRYQFESEIGRGGMGVVYRARQLSLNRPVAIKVLPTRFALDEQFRQRFQQEAQVIATLVHENIVHVYDIEPAEGTYFIVMELIDGSSLRELRASRRFGVEEVRSIGIAVARALRCAHAQGIVHRDVKSHNVMVTRDAKVKLMDFGIARVDGTGIKTQTGSVLGTPEYMAPEQARTGETSPRTDLYSLGVLLYELATGRLPFTGNDPFSVAFKHVSEDPAPPRSVEPGLPEWLERVILKAMAKAPEERYQSAAELERDLASQATGPQAGGVLPALAGGFPAGHGARTTPMLDPGTGPTHGLHGPAGGTVTGQTYVPVAMPRSWGPWALAAAVLVAVAALWILLGRRESPPGNPSPAAAPPAGSTSAETAAASLAGSGLNDPVTAPPTRAPIAGVPPAAVPPAPPRPRPDPAPAGPAPAEALPRPAELEPSPPAPVPVAVAPAYSPPAAISEVLSCREGVEFHTDPEEATVSIDGRRIGVADDWDGMGGGKAWRSSPGTYVACMSGPALQTVCVEIHLDPGARKKICDVDTDLEDVE